MSLFPPPREPGFPLQGSNTVSAGPHMSFMHGCIFREPEPGGVIFGKLRSFWSRLCTLDNNCQGIIFLVILCPQHRPLLIGLCHAWVKFQGSCIDYTYHCCDKTLHKSKHKEVRAGTSGGHTTSEVWKQQRRMPVSAGLVLRVERQPLEWELLPYLG